MNQNAPGLSVILPVYHSKKTICRAVASVLAQTFEDFELVIVEDGSKDSSWAILSELAQADSRICLFRNAKNRGLLHSLIRAILLAWGEYLARLDADDEMLPTRLAKQKDFLDKHPEIGLASSWYFLMGRKPDLDRIDPLPFTPEAIKAEMLKENPICHPSVTMRKSAFYAVGGYREEFVKSEDYDLWLRFSKVYGLANIPEPLVRYRLSLGGVSINRRHQMRVFHELTKASYLQPNRNLQELRKKIVETIPLTKTIPA